MAVKLKFPLLVYTVYGRNTQHHIARKPLHMPCIYIYRVVQYHTCTVYVRWFWAGKSPNVRSCTVYIYGSGQPYAYTYTGLPITIHTRCMKGDFGQGNHQTHGHVRLGTTLHICRVGQNHICTVYIRYFWQGNHQIYGHIRCIFSVLANPAYM